MKLVEHNGRKFIAFDYPKRGGCGDGMPSIWVCQSVFKGMTRMRFTGNFAIHDSKHGNHGDRGTSRRDSEILSKCAKKLPCNVRVRMMGAQKGQKVFVVANLVEWGKINDETIGVILAGISQ